MKHSSNKVSRSGYRWFRFLYTVLIIVMASECFSQGGDSTSFSAKPHKSPSRAALYSAVLPGLGQIYNEKYWKLPIVYAGFGTFGYFIATNNKEYQKFQDAYDYENGDLNPDKYNEYVDKYNLEELQAGRDYYRRNRDLSIILTTFWYALTIVDAAVDAYLFDYDVTDDISLKLKPVFAPLVNKTAVPAELKLTYKLGSHK